MKTTIKTSLGLTAAAALVAPAASGSLILLAGFNKFDDNPAGATANFTKSGADEGLLAANSSITFVGGARGGSSDTGGSTDNWYGPEPASGDTRGIETNQDPFNTSTGGTNPTLNDPYVFETDPTAGERLDPNYPVVGTAPALNGAPTPSNLSPSGTSSTANGRIRNLNGTDLFVINSLPDTIELGYLLFDSFVGDASTGTNSRGSFEQFTIGISRAPGSSLGDITEEVSVIAGYAGVNSLSGTPFNGPLPSPTDVENEIDYGVGTNYLDYVVDLRGYELAPNDELTIGFNFTGIDGAVLRGDNFALVAIPEPSSALALGGLLGLTLLGSRRRK